MQGNPIQYPKTIACTECGTLHAYTAITANEAAYCHRCEALLYRNNPKMVDIAMALSITGLILFLLTNAFPLLALRAQGLVMEMSLWKATIVFWQQGYYFLSVLLALNLIIFPLFELLGLLFVMLNLRQPNQSALAIWIFRWMHEVKPWGMLEVFMLGVLVAVVKLGDIATLIIGPAFWSFAFLLLAMAAASASIDRFTVWQRLKPCGLATRDQL